MAFFELDEPTEEELRAQEESSFFDPGINFVKGAVKGLAGAVEGTIELATLFQVDIDTNLGLGKTEGTAEAVGSFAAELAAAFFTGGAALAGGAKVVTKAGQVAKSSRIARSMPAARLFKGMPVQAATSLAGGIAKRTKRVGSLLEGEAKFALGEFITVTGDRGLDVVSMLGLDDTDLGAHFAIHDGKSELEKRLVSGLNGLGFSAALTGAFRGVKKGLTRGKKADVGDADDVKVREERQALGEAESRNADGHSAADEEAHLRGEQPGLDRAPTVTEAQRDLLHDAKDEFGPSIEVRSHASPEEIVAVGRAAGAEIFDTTGSFSRYADTDAVSTNEAIRKLSDEIARIDEAEKALNAKGGGVSVKHTEKPLPPEMEHLGEKFPNHRGTNVEISGDKPATSQKHSPLPEADQARRRDLMKRRADLERGFGKEMQALVDTPNDPRKFVQESLRSLRKTLNGVNRRITKRLEKLKDTRELDQALDQLDRFQADLKSGSIGKPIKLGAKGDKVVAGPNATPAEKAAAREANVKAAKALETREFGLTGNRTYMEVLTPSEQAKYVQTAALAGPPKAGVGGAQRATAKIELPGELNGLVDDFAEKQVKSLLGDAATPERILHAQTTYRQHMGNLLDSVSKSGDGAAGKVSARDNLIALERIDAIHGMYKAMKGEFFLPDHIAARRISGRRVMGMTEEEIAEAWAAVPKWQKRRVESLDKYTEQIKLVLPNAKKGEVLSSILKLNDGTWGQKFRALKVGSIMTSLSLQSANIATTALRNVEEVMSEQVGGAILGKTKTAQIADATESAERAMRNGEALVGLQIASIQRVRFALVNMPQWFRAASASFKAQGSVGVGPRVSPGSVGSEELGGFGKSALGLSPHKEGIFAFGSRLASAADDATKASVVAQSVTNNLFNTILHASGKNSVVSTRPEAFQNALMDAMNAAIRAGDTLTNENVLKIVRQASAQTGTTEAAREALRGGIINAHKKQADKFLEESFRDLSSRGMKTAQHRTFTNLRDAAKGGSIEKDMGAHIAAPVRAIRHLTDEVLSDGVRAAVLPFVNTPINVFLYGLDFTPLSKSFWDGLYTGIGGTGSVADRFPLLKNATDLLDAGDINASRKVGRAVTGISMSGGLIAAHQANLIELRGAGPRDPVKNKAWRLAGNQKYSIKVGGTSISFDRMGAMGMPFRLAADLSDVWDNPYGVDGTDQAVTNMIVATAETMMSGFLMEQSADMFDAVMSGDSGRIGRILGSEAVYMVPAASSGRLAAITGAAEGTVGASLLAMGSANVLGQSVARIADPSVAPERDLSFVEAAKASLADRYKLFGKDKARNILGNVVTPRSGTQEFFGAAVGIARFATPENDTLATELASLNFPIAPPATSLSGLDLLNPAYASAGRSAFDRYSELIGKVKINGSSLERKLVDTIRSSRYRRMPSEGVTDAGLRSPRHEALMAVVSKYRDKARKQIARERPALGQDLRDRKIAQSALIYGQSPEAITARFFPDL